MRHLQEQVDRLQADVIDLTETIQELKDTMEQLRGQVVSRATALQQAASWFHGRRG